MISSHGDILLTLTQSTFALGGQTKKAFHESSANPLSHILPLFGVAGILPGDFTEEETIKIFTGSLLNIYRSIIENSKVMIYSATHIGDLSCSELFSFVVNLQGLLARTQPCLSNNVHVQSKDCSFRNNPPFFKTETCFD